MPNIKIKETEYYNCPYCHRIIPDYAICNCVKIYNQALEDLLKVCGGGTYESDCELCTFAIFKDDIRVGCKLMEQIK